MSPSSDKESWWKTLSRLDFSCTCRSCSSIVDSSVLFSKVTREVWMKDYINWRSHHLLLATVLSTAKGNHYQNWHRVLNSVFNLQKTSFDIVAVPNQRNMKHSCLHILNIQQDNVCIISQIALSTCCSWKRLHYSLCNKQVKDDCKNKQQKMTY